MQRSCGVLALRQRSGAKVPAAHQFVDVLHQLIGAVMEPSDLEVFLLGRISGRTGLPYRSTTNWDDPLGSIRQQRLEKSNVYGPYGFSD